MPEQERMEIQLGDPEAMNFVAQTPTGQKIVMDADPEFGGRGLGPEPIHLLMAGLGGCTGMDVISILRKMRQPVRGYRIVVEGKRRSEYPKYYTRIKLTHYISGDVDEESLKKAIKLSDEKYCSFSASLRERVEIVMDYEIDRRTALSPESK